MAICYLFLNAFSELTYAFIVRVSRYMYIYICIACIACLLACMFFDLGALLYIYQQPHTYIHTYIHTLHFITMPLFRAQAERWGGGGVGRGVWGVGCGE